MKDMDPEDPEIVILLALYNGAENIGAQLQSIARQTYDNWSLIVSDDGSGDDGPEIVRQFSKENPDKKITLVSGPKAGFVKNFLSLLAQCDPNASYVALSDQDDVWLNNKLEQAIVTLQKLPENTSTLYCSRTYIWNEQQQTQTLSGLFPRPPGFQNALVQNIASGNTMVINQGTLKMLQDACAKSVGTTCHDWWIYQMVSGSGGLIVYDTEAFIKYRQHANNLIGANNTTVASVSRIRLMLRGRFQAWNTNNIAVLQANEQMLTVENRATLKQFVSAREKWVLPRIAGLYKSGIHRQTLKGNIGLVVAALIGKI